jgi:hypothetical protein
VPGDGSPTSTSRTVLLPRYHSATWREVAAMALLWRLFVVVIVLALAPMQAWGERARAI